MNTRNPNSRGKRFHFIVEVFVLGRKDMTPETRWRFCPCDADSQTLIQLNILSRQADRTSHRMLLRLGSFFINNFQLFSFDSFPTESFHFAQRGRETNSHILLFNSSCAVEFADTNRSVAGCLRTSTRCALVITADVFTDLQETAAGDFQR